MNIKRSHYGPLGASVSLQTTPRAAVQNPTGYIHSIETGGTVDGPGIRYVAFLQGCPLRCLYCHNPDSWQMKTGKTMTSSELLEDVLRYKAFIKSGGVTLSGGEPLTQPDFVEDFFNRARAQGLHTALDTSGAIPLAKSRDAIDASDLILLDIKALDPVLCKKLTGMDNKNALELLAYLEQTGKPVWIRHVVVPGYTDDLSQLEALAHYLRDFSVIQRVELLPFHQMATYKWEALRLTYALKDTPVPTKAFMAQAAEPFIRLGLIDG
jgi:pyruvate formate lyase activating enzyme